MRKNVFVVWVDDDGESPTIKGLKRIVSKHIESKGYSIKISPFSNIEEANVYFSNPKNKVDMFIIDYNIGDPSGLTGFDYLANVRKSGKYRQYFVLYSNNNEDVLKNELSNIIKNKELSEITNFEIISLEKDDEKDDRFKKSIDIALSWWDELNALRGIITSENGKFDYYGRQLLDISGAYSYKNWFDFEQADYKEVIDKLKKYCSDNSIFGAFELKNKFDNWHKLRKLRNSCAHAVEKYDNTLSKYFLENPLTGEKIYDNDLLRKRQELILLSKDVETIIDAVKNHLNCTLLSLI